MATPRKESTIPERLKKIEQELRRIRLSPSLSQSAVEPLAVKGSGWYDSSTGNEPKVFDGTDWVPVRDETIAVAQGTADTAQSTAVAAAADAATALGKFPIVATDITDGAISTPKLSANAIDGMTITGALFRTAASGQRIEIDSISAENEMRFYSGHAGEINPGYIAVGASELDMQSPNISGFGGGSLYLGGDSGPGGLSQGDITADVIDLVADSAGLTVGIIGTSAPGDTPGIWMTGTVLKFNGNDVLVAGSNPQPVAVADATALTSAALTTTYAAGSPVVGTAFTAPPTGKVYITVGGRIQCQTTGNTIYLSFEVRTGATVGSGTVVLATDAGRAVAAGGNATGFTFARVGGSKRYLLTGLTPGSSYNVRTMHACQTTTATGDLYNRDLLIEPVL